MSRYCVKEYESMNIKSIYVLSNEDLEEKELWEAVEDYDCDYVEMDDAVASYNGYKNCYIFHEN